MGDDGKFLKWLQTDEIHEFIWERLEIVAVTGCKVLPALCLEYCSDFHSCSWQMRQRKTFGALNVPLCTKNCIHCIILGVFDFTKEQQEQEVY